jgi:hypothetical protein
LMFSIWASKNSNNKIKLFLTRELISLSLSKLNQTGMRTLLDRISTIHQLSLG